MAASSEFARAELKKYGWNEGKGLGKHEDGITLAIKPKLKFDKHGVSFVLGHDSGLEYKCFWWAQAFNKAASNIIVKNSSDSSPIITERKKRNTKRKATNSKNTCYKNFVSVCTIFIN
uniref:G patch domain-containing protein 4 n=1 Tax=Strigamia maritima TaxID=126957 RepID=T1IUZ8_STRMM